LPYDLPRQTTDILTGSLLNDARTAKSAGQVGQKTWQSQATIFATGFACPEGPCHNGEGDLFVADWAAGVVRRVSPQGQVTDFIDTGGMPAGACFGPNGQLAVCDTGRKEVLSIAPHGVIRSAASRHQGQPFLGPGDCTFDSQGNLYFSDADGFHPCDPSGSVYLLRPNGEVELVAGGFAFPNGLVVSKDGRYLYLAETFANRIHRFGLDERGRAGGQEVFAELEGGLGPDGLALDEEGNLYAAHFGKGVVAVLDPNGSLVAELATGGFLPTNVVFWNGSLYVTELERGHVMRLDIAL
jgi:gluconolactonase